MDPADRKKREPPDPDGQPLNKRHALASSATSVHEENVDPKVCGILGTGVYFIAYLWFYIS